MSDYPLELAGAHGHIAAYRHALDDAVAALRSAHPYIYNVACDPANAPWRRDTADATLANVLSAIERAELELAVTNP